MARPKTRKAWTADEDDALREMTCDRTTDAEMAASLGRTPQSVKERRKWLRRRQRVAGSPGYHDCRYLVKDPNVGCPPNADRRALALEVVRVEGGVTTRIAARLGVGRRAARRLLQRMAADGLVAYVSLGPRRGRWEVPAEKGDDTRDVANPNRKRRGRRDTSPATDEEE